MIQFEVANCKEQDRHNEVIKRYVDQMIKRERYEDVMIFFSVWYYWYCETERDKYYALGVLD